MDKLLKTKYGNIAIDLYYKYISVYDSTEDLAPTIRHNINEINTCNHYRFYTARVSTPEDGKAWPIGTILRANGDDIFTINQVDYNHLEGEFKVRISEKTGKPELWGFTCKAQRVGGPHATYGALTDKAATTVREFLYHTLLAHVVKHEAEIRQERRIGLLNDAKKALATITARAEEYKTAVDNLTQIVQFPGWDKV